ncbi:MAG: hypothetical protein Q9169_007580, partial [Polycauliona sp. 2 TL-2023]
MPAVDLSTENRENGPEEEREDLGEFILIDDLFRTRAKDIIQKPLIAFPKSDRGISDFECFTGRDLDRFVEHAARHYMAMELKLNEHARVALLGPTNIEWIATFFGLLRAGFAVVTLSPRISAQAIVKLMSETHCETIVHAETSQLLRVIGLVADETSIKTLALLCRTGFDRPPSNEPPLVRDIDKAKEAERLAVIMHSSGSTGLPKPIYTNHKRYVQSLNPVSPGSRDFMTLPICSTEIGFLGSSGDRASGSQDWAYLRIAESKMKQIWPRPIGGDQYEFVFREDYPVSVESNSDDPPNSFRSKDVFSPHPKVNNAWKYHGRLDDRVTLVNGEKVLPLPIEGRIKEHPLVRENVVFGVDRSLPGLLVFRSEAASAMEDDAFIDAIWPDVEAANENAEGFSQIGKNMIVPLPAGTEYPQADKGSFIRPQLYNAFNKEIEDAYVRLDQNEEGTLQLDIHGLEEHLMHTARELIGYSLENKTTDFFKAGMDSLRALQMRGLMVKDLDLGGNGKHLKQNIVFEASNVENLARHLHDLCRGQTSATRDPKIAMGALIQDYGVFQRHISCSKPVPDVPVVLLTGATGGLGAQLVSQLSTNPSIARVYCLLRGHEPLERLRSSLEDRKLDMQLSKVTAMTSDLAHPSFGLDESTFLDLQSSITHIIHAAWPVNFQLPLSSFEPHIQGLHNLLRLSLLSPYTSPAKLLFCSSVSTALGSPSPVHIPETMIEDLDHALNMGYGQSKLVGEHIVAAAVRTAGAQASILRIGQVVGDCKFGMWNDREAFPSIIRSALTTGMLPELPIKCEWLPVDTLAECVLQLAGLAVQHGDEGKELYGDSNAEELRKWDEAAKIEMDTQAATNESNSNIGEDPTDLSEEMTNCNQDT